MLGNHSHKTELDLLTSFSHSKKLYYWILAIWFIINLIQSAFTELFHDEAYYYFYSSNLALGYYDHPPVIAFMIKLGTLVLKNELGVRLAGSIMSVITIITIVKLAKVKNFLLFFAQPLLFIMCMILMRIVSEFIEMLIRQVHYAGLVITWLPF